MSQGRIRDMQDLPFTQPPVSLCLLRLSALGDCANMLPIIHTLQAHWPQTRLTWVIGEIAARLVEGLPGVELVVLDKQAGRRGRKALREQLAGRQFDALLHMHPGFRADLASRMIPAGIRLGFDRERSRDLHGFFVNRRIHARREHQRHVLDGFFAFLECLGIEQRVLDWSIPIAERDRLHAEQILPGDQPTLLISPGSSHHKRNWLASRYAAVADHAVDNLGMRVALIGGPTPIEVALGESIVRNMRCSAINLIGKSSLKQLLAIMARASVLICPDSGPSHIANITRTPTIALHAASDSRRGGPFMNLDWAVDRYDTVTRARLGKPADEVRWGKKIEKEGVMEAISVDDVTRRLTELARHLGVAPTNQPDQTNG